MNRALNPQRWLALALAAQLGLGQPLVALAQEAPAPAPVPSGGQTTMTQSANGTPVVNIAAPNAAGVSHNRFSSYDVGTGGLVLNNSAADAVSLIGGGTLGNQNLANGQSASLILNEVTGRNAASLLQGYQEILGPSAELVIANPWGITCDGCGFVNTPRVTLTTGTPTLRNDGSLAGFTITGGTLAVGAGGLDASRQQALDLLARDVRIDGTVFGGYAPENVSGDVQVVGGAHQFDYATRAGSALPPGATPGSAPQFAIDSSALGGIYADRIRLLVNEQGAGVRAAGNLAATGNDLDITANGHVELRGAASAARDVNVRGTDVIIDQAGDNPYVYAGRDLTVNATGTLTLGAGGVGSEGNTSLGGAAIVDNGGASDYRFAGDVGTLAVDASGDVTLNGGTWTAPTLSVNGDAVRVGADSVLYATADTGEALALEAAGTLAVDGAAYSAADARLRADHIEIGAEGVAAATGHLDVATHPSSPNAVINHGSLSGGTVNIDARGGTGNTGIIYAEEQLDIRGELLANGATGEIVAGTAAGGTVNVTTTDVLNDGTIWSEGDLDLTTTRLQQEINGTDALIGAGRDLTVEFNGAAALAAGDLYAGRDLAIRGEHLTDTGATGANNTTADVRYAGRDLTAHATTDVEIAGGQWVSEGALGFEGDSVLIGGHRDAQNVLQLAPGVAVFGAQGGTGTTTLTARNGVVALLDDAAVYSGGDLAVTQPGTFLNNSGTQLHAAGRLSIDAESIDNRGVIAGADVALGANGTLRAVTNRGTGIIYGSDRIDIGNSQTGYGVDSIVNEAAADPANPDTGIFGGAVDWRANSLQNHGLIEIGGGRISTFDFINHGTGALRSFTGAGSNGLTVSARTLWNEGLLYDSSSLRLNASQLTNTPSGTIGSAGFLGLYSTGTNADVIDNVGDIWGYDIDVYAQRGFLNGRDPGVAANRIYPGSIYAANTLSLMIGGDSSLRNHGSIESSGDIYLIAAGLNATLANEMSMVSSPEVMWLQGGSPTVERDAYLGLMPDDPRGDGARESFTFDGVTYYTFDDSSYAYRDHRITYIDWEQLTPEAAAVRRPGIRAGNDLLIEDFQSVTNVGGILGADRNLSITSTAPGASVTNQSHVLRYRDRILEGITERRCFFGVIAVECGGGVTNLGDPVERGGFPQPGYRNHRAYAPAFAGEIFAGHTLSVTVGTVTNASHPGRYVGSLPTTPAATGVSVTPEAPGVTGANPQLNLGGARIPLPTSANGRFVPGQRNDNGPLIETNPLFGIDSIHLGSDYLARLLGLTPEEQARRLGDDNYEAWLIQEQLESATGRSVLAAYYGAGDMIEALYDNAAEEAERLELGFGRALTPEQVASLKSDIVWMVEQEIQGQKVLVPVVYLSEATRAEIGTRSSMSGYNVDINADTLRNEGGDIVATNALSIRTTGNIENLSGRMAGWNVRLDAGGDIVNSTLTRRSGTAENGRDIAERTGTIEAGNTAVLQAARDVNVSGAWVLAGKDAALIAGRNVTVESQALNIDRNLQVGDGSYTRNTQVLQGGGVVAGRHAVIEGRNDVNVIGADVAAGGTAVLRAHEGNVNIGVRELTDTTTSTDTRSGRYDTLDRDVENMQLGIGMGTEDRTTTHQNTRTIGAGSRISGAGVVVATGRGDIDVTGSDIEAGEEGVVIDSAGNVNIHAYDHRDETTDTVDTVRLGARIDGSYDGVHVGTQASGETTSTTTTQTVARTSGISSGGNVVIRARGDIDNEGTRIDAAGNVVMSGENVTNRAAQDTYTSTTTRDTWDTRQQVGFTTNGTGSSIAGVAEGKDQEVTVNNLEAQFRVTGSGSTDSSTVEASTARTTDIRAGGNIIVHARGSAVDEGTQYQAGNDIVISADSYENRAAADRASISTDGTRGSGQLTAGLTSAAEVAVAASAEGSHDQEDTSQSTAVTGGMRAGGAVIIDARRGDLTLEGTNIDGAKGVGLRAAGDVNLKQANDSTWSETSGESGHARVSGSVSVTGTSGGVGAGAGGRTYEHDEGTRTARVGSIRSGDGSVSIAAGRDIKSQGTNIEAAEDISLSAARDIDLAAATSTITRTGQADGGGADVNVGFGTGQAKGTGSANVAVDAERSRTNYSETTETGSTLRAGNRLTVNAGRDARLEGTQAEAGEAHLRTGGNLTLESAQRTVSDDSYGVTARVEASGSKGQGARGASSVGSGSSGSSNNAGGNAGGGNVGADVSRSFQDVETNTNATITTRGRTTVTTGGDLTLAGANIDAGGGVSGVIGGDLDIETRVDREVVNQTDVNAYVGVGAIGGSNSTSRFDAAQDRTQMAANAAAQTGAYADVDATNRDNRTVGRASGIAGGTGGIQMSVAGDTTLTGAANQADDFLTSGTTTVKDVETRTSEATTDLRLIGTVASAAGADRGKGGDFNLSVNIPEGPAARRGTGDVNDVDPATRQRPRSDALTATDPADSNTRRSTTIDPGRYIETGDTVAPPVRPTAGNDGTQRLATIDPGRYIETGETVAPPARPTTSAENDNTRRPSIVDPGRYVETGNAVAQPVRPTANAENDNTRRPTPGDVATDTQPARPAAEPDTNDAHRPIPIDPGTYAETGTTVAQPVRPTTSPENDNARRPSSPEVARDAQPSRPIISADDNTRPADVSRTATGPADNVRPQTSSRRDNSAIDALWPEATDDSVSIDEKRRRAREELAIRVDRDPELTALLRRAEGRDDISISLIRDNLGEIDAFTELERNRHLREPMLQRVADSLQGPIRREDGHTLFPVLPQYVGEDVAGFVNWHDRDYYFGTWRRGEFYEHPSRTNGTVDYLTPREQADAQVFVDPGDGSIRLGPNGRTLDKNRTYLFVVTEDGRMLAHETVGGIHHSSLGAGGRVLMAGEFNVDDNGHLQRIRNASGHYRPSGDAFRVFLRDLARSGINVKGANATELTMESLSRQGNYGTRQTATDLLKQPELLNSPLPPMMAPPPKLPPTPKVSGGDRRAHSPPHRANPRLAA